MSKAEDARATFIKGFNCTQAVLAEFAEDFGLDRVMAYKVAAGFGGGMGHMGKTCGAVTGAFMVIGLKYGMTAADGSQSHRAAFGKVREFTEKFRAKHGSITCSKLLGADFSKPGEFREAVKKGIPQKICPQLVQDAAEIVESLIKS
ncbi:MAG: C-GCAxxG-C-C family protein [Dehalococcoidia bacterium]|jgi:C_GCAxxG_C_C family probable redox protein